MPGESISSNIIDFLIIGAAKSGTTWLANNLRQHPGIFIPEQKELFYFNEKMIEFTDMINFNRTKPLEWYISFFKDAKSHQIKGEAAPAYLWDKNTPRNIYNFNPHIKLISILREPVDRAFSHYLYDLGRSVLSQMEFHKAIEEHPILIEMGMYGQSLERYYELFPPKNILVVLYDDLINDNQALLKEVERFLGVEEFIPENIDQAENVTGVPRFIWFNRFITKGRHYLRTLNLKFMIDLLRAIGLAKLSMLIMSRNVKPFESKPILDPAVKAQVKQIFQSDIAILEELINRDLSAWK